MTSRNIHQQIDEIDRELALRASVYPGLVGRGKLRQAEATEHMLRLQAVRATLVWCRDHRDTISQVMETYPDCTGPNPLGDGA